MTNTPPSVSVGPTIITPAFMTSLGMWLTKSWMVRRGREARRGGGWGRWLGSSLFESILTFLVIAVYRALQTPYMLANCERFIYYFSVALIFTRKTKC